MVVHGFQLPTAIQWDVKFMRSNENCIRTYGRHELAAYYFLKARFPNSVIYRGFRDEVALRTGWKARTYFSKVKRMVKAGLASKDPSGNVHLIPLRELIDSRNRKAVSHRCTVRTDLTEKEVKDWLSLKLVEEKHRQIRHARNRAEAATGMKGHKQTVKAAELGYEAMSMQCMSQAIGVSVSTAKRWKRRGVASQSLSQVDRVSYLPSWACTRAAEASMDLLAAEANGAVVVSGGRVSIRRPSMYRMQQEYRKP